MGYHGNVGPSGHTARAKAFNVASANGRALSTTVPSDVTTEIATPKDAVDSVISVGYPIPREARLSCDMLLVTMRPCHAHVSQSNRDTNVRHNATLPRVFHNVAKIRVCA